MCVCETLNLGQNYHPDKFVVILTATKYQELTLQRGISNYFKLVILKVSLRWVNKQFPKLKNEACEFSIL